MSADFSVQASGNPNAEGIVLLIRSPEDQKRWYNMPEVIRESKDAPKLHIIGRGLTFKRAIKHANELALQEKPVIC